MNEEWKIELERAKMRNYILEKENEIILGSIGCLAKEKKELLGNIDRLTKEKNELLENIGSLSNDKQELLRQLEQIQNSKGYRMLKKVKSIVRRK